MLKDKNMVMDTMFGLTEVNMKVSFSKTIFMVKEPSNGAMDEYTKDNLRKTK